MLPPGCVRGHINRSHLAVTPMRLTIAALPLMISESGAKGPNALRWRGSWCWLNTSLRGTCQQQGSRS
jgi:hypothetical protein